MKRSRLILLVILAIVAALIIWRVGFYAPEAKRVERKVKAAEPNEPNEPSEPNKPGEPNEPSEPNKPSEPNEPSEPNKPSEPNEPNEPMENINFKDFEMKSIIQKLAEWTGKVIIPHDEAMKQKISIYSPKKVPRSQALAMIYSALRAKGFIAEHTDETIYLKPLKDAKYLLVPTIPPGIPLAAIENKEQIVRKFFKLTNYSPTSMSEIIGAMLAEYAYVSADETTGKLLIIDTVKNLIHFEKIIQQFDIPEAEQTITKIFDITYGDPGEIVQVLRILLGGEGRRVGRPTSRRDRDRGERRDRDRDRNRRGAATVVGPTGGPVILIPEPRRKWIIASASPGDMDQIEEWITKLDTTERVTPEYEAVQIKYASVDEVADRLNEVLREMPGAELETSILIQPLRQARQVVIYGRKDMREIAKKLIAEIDIPSEELETKVFKLEHADPEQIKENIDALYGEESGGYRGYYYYRYLRDRSPADVVKVIAFPTMQQVTVIASPENMLKIAKQIADWDMPIDVEKVKPMIITLVNTDPVKMADLLSELFTEEADEWDWRDYYFGRSEEQKKVVGPLYGQLTFRAVPDTKKIIVISKMPEAYRVIENLIRELDEAEMTEVPRVVQIEYADPEDLSERLNAIFSEPGASVKIRLTKKSLSKTGMEKVEEGEGTDSGEDSGAAGEYTPPWTGQSRRPDEMPISKVIGRIRFIPDPRSKAILVLAPKEFMDEIVETIKALDEAGKQVRLRAVVVEVSHSDLTSLGLRLADTIEDGGLIGLDDAITLGAASKLTEAYHHGRLTLEMGVNVTTLLDFLVKRTDAKILNQQSLWTKDNEEADFFKGETVPFETGGVTTAVGGQTTAVEYQEVGMTLRVRPNITPQRNVDMNLDLTISQRTGEEVAGQPVRSSMNTTTTAIVRDGQTIVLGGILFQKDTVTERKMALLGDLPLLGGLFRHNDTIQSNTELIVFITPEVIDQEDMGIETKQAEKKLKNMLGEFEGSEDANEGEAGD